MRAEEVIRMKRRQFIMLLGSTAAWPVAAALAEVSHQRPLVGFLSPGAEKFTMSHTAPSFLQGMRDLGYVEGRNFDIVYRFSEGYQDRLPALAGELIQLKPNAILASAVVAAVAARKATASIPIVCPALADAVHLGLVASEATARALEVKVVSADANRPEDLDDALQALASARVDVVIVLQTSMLISENARIAESALAKRLATAYGYREHVASGGLISYGVDLRWCFQRGAYFVDKILHGAAPGDLPVEFPTKVVLSVNLKTAKALGLAVLP